MMVVSDLDPTIASNAIDSGWIPFKFMNPDIPIPSFVAKANGSCALWLTLDTGNASGIHVSEGAARRLGMDFSNPVEVPEDEKYSYGDEVAPSAFLSSLASLEIGAWRLDNVDATISNYVDYLAKTLDAPWEANFGREMMQNLCVAIDYPGSRLRFSSDDHSEATTTPFRLGDAPWVIVRARIHGFPAKNFILDTGAGGTMVDAELAEETGLELGDEVEVQGATGRGFARISAPTSIQIGRKKVSGLRVCASSFVRQLSSGAGIELSGIIGYDFFKDSVLVIDYKRRRIGFK